MPRPSFTLAEVHENIIRKAINRYHFLTAEQMVRILGYSNGSIKTLKAYLKVLADTKYLHSFYLPTRSKQRPFVYALGMRGRKYLLKSGEYTGIYYLPSEEEEKTYFTLMHVLELNDFLISCATLARDTPSLHLFDMQHDLMLKRTPFTIMDKKGKTHGLVPDGLVDIRMEREGRRDRRYFFWIELDRDNISNDALREKIRNILLFTETGLQQKYFGKAEPIPFLWVTTAGQRRVEKMQTLARMEFNARPQSSKNQMLKFASVPALMQDGYPTPEQIFCTPYWTSPYGEPREKATLIELE